MDSTVPHSNTAYLQIEELSIKTKTLYFLPGMDFYTTENLHIYWEKVL